MTLPSSASAPVAEQVRPLPTTIPELGEMLEELMVGEVFPTLTVVAEVVESPSESVAVAVQAMVEPTSVSVAEDSVA